MVHRDVKPSNMMLSPEVAKGKPDTSWDATLKILDIGLGRELFDDEAPPDETVTQLTDEGSVLGTPDYDRWEWVYIEKLYGLAAPGGYADEHISHYTRASLLDQFARMGYSHEATRYILRGELILAFRKPATV